MPEKIGLIAGKGQFPLLFADAARRRGLEVVAVAHRGETDPALEPLCQHCRWISVGQLGKLIRAFKEAGHHPGGHGRRGQPGPPLPGFPAGF
jgi:UDP-2,3-diacylglucosamine hydrolase